MMDAVELAIPQAVVVSKLMGSEVLGVGCDVGVSVAKVDPGQSGGNSTEIRSSVHVDACSGRGGFRFPFLMKYIDFCLIHFCFVYVQMLVSTP